MTKRKMIVALKSRKSCWRLVYSLAVICCPLMPAEEKIITGRAFRPPSRPSIPPPTSHLPPSPPSPPPPTFPPSLSPFTFHLLHEPYPLPWNLVTVFSTVLAALRSRVDGGFRFPIFSMPAPSGVNADQGWVCALDRLLVAVRR